MLVNQIANQQIIFNFRRKNLINDLFILLFILKLKYEKNRRKIFY